MLDNSNLHNVINKFTLPSGLASGVFMAQRGDLYDNLCKASTDGNIKKNIIVAKVETLNDIWDVYFWLSEVFHSISQITKGSTKGCVYLDILEALSINDLYLYNNNYTKSEIPKFIFIDSFLDKYSNTKDYFNLCNLMMRYVLNSNNFSSRCLSFSTKASKEDLAYTIERLPTNFSIVLKDLILLVDSKGNYERI